MNPGFRGLSMSVKIIVTDANWNGELCATSPCGRYLRVLLVARRIAKSGGPAHNIGVIRLTNEGQSGWADERRNPSSDLRRPFLHRAVIGSLSVWDNHSAEVTNPNRYRTVLLAQKWAPKITGKLNPRTRV
jgi:hypothetical protein